MASNSVAMKTKAIKTEAVIFFLSACCIEIFNFTFRPLSLKIENRTWPLLQIYGFGFSKRESTRLWINFPMRMKAGWHRFIYRVRISLASINPNIRFPNVCWFSNKNCIINCFSLKTVDGPPTNSSEFFPKDLYLPPVLVRFLHQCVCVDDCWPGLVKYNQLSAYRYLCRGKR